MEVERAEKGDGGGDGGGGLISRLRDITTHALIRQRRDLALQERERQREREMSES
jgi:hypothetical protein